ncbi:LysR substrate-binding domain-containing protein [Streptomyces hokutonensis]|uniref:LysR substrate-binding domain-containing protein n=1 Tax=Streptomyces hokutonensis TaxID=1306990 RepID=UPI00039AEC45
MIASWDALPAPPPWVAVHDLLVDPTHGRRTPRRPSTGRPAPRRDPDRPTRAARRVISDDRGGRSSGGEQLDRDASEAGFTPRIRYRTASYAVAPALVGTGIGVALVSRLVLTDVPGTTHGELAQPRLHAVTPT